MLLTLTALTKHIIHKIWIITLSFLSLYGCEYGSPQIVDYTGQIDSIIDIDGNKYKTIGIGTQIWMQENLRVTHFNDGSKITLLSESKDWYLNYDLNTPGYCWYDNDSDNNNSLYGALYNFYSIETGLLCPTGWHVSSQSEWEILIDYLGGKEIAGGKIKDYFGNYWTSPNRCVENNGYFIGLPGGYRHFYNGTYYAKGLVGCWWANRISKEDDSKALQISVNNSDINITETYVHKNGGASVRCVKDLIITIR